MSLPDFVKRFGKAFLTRCGFTHEEGAGNSLKSLDPYSPGLSRFTMETIFTPSSMEPLTIFEGGDPMARRASIHLIHSNSDKPTDGEEGSSTSQVIAFPEPDCRLAENEDQRNRATPMRVLRAAEHIDFECVVVIGERKDGVTTIRSNMTNAELLWHSEMMKRFAMGDI